MLNTILPFCRVQRDRTGGRESWRWADSYKFFMHSPTSRRKYLVEMHAYENHLYTADFYAKVNNVNRYRLRTNQQAAGKLGGTVLAILANVLRQDPQACFGFPAIPTCFNPVLFKIAKPARPLRRAVFFGAHFWSAG